MFSNTVRRGKMLVTWKLRVEAAPMDLEGCHAFDPGAVQ